MVIPVILLPVNAAQLEHEPDSNCLCAVCAESKDKKCVYRSADRDRLLPACVDCQAAQED